MTRRTLLNWTMAGAVTALAAGAVWWSYHYAHFRHNRQAAQRALAAGDADLALVHLTACLAWRGDDAEVRLLAAQAARLAGDYEAAEAHLSYCESATDPPSEPVQRERALLQVQQGDFRGYLESLKSTLDSSAPPADVLEAMARGLEATLFFDQAAECLQRLFAQEPDHARGHVQAGNLFLRKRYAEPARHEFEAAVKQLPDAFRPRLRLAECLLDLGEVREAASHLATLAERYPDAPELLSAQARVAVYRARFAEARGILHRLLAAHPDHLDALIALGQLEYHQGDPKDALPPLERAVKRHPDKPDAWETLARCHAALRNADDAKRCLKEFDRASREFGEVTRLTVRLMQEQADDVKLRIEVAERYERLHEPAKAIQWRLCVLHVDPHHTPSQEALARLFEQTGQPHRAARWKKGWKKVSGPG